MQQGLRKQQVTDLTGIDGLTLYKLASDPATPAATQHALAFNPTYNLVLASNPALVPELQREMAARCDPELHIALASNPSLLPELQVDLLLGDHQIRSRLLENPALTPKLQHHCATSEDDALCLVVAANPSLPPGLQRLLATDPSIDVRDRLAANRSLLPELQLALSTDGPHVRDVLTQNPALVPRDSMAPSFLMGSTRGLHLFQRLLEPLDQPIVRSLVRSWEGSLAELVLACQELGPDPSVPPTPPPAP